MDINRLRCLSLKSLHSPHQINASSATPVREGHSDPCLARQGFRRHRFTRSRKMDEDPHDEGNAWRVRTTFTQRHRTLVRTKTGTRRHVRYLQSTSRQEPKRRQERFSKLVQCTYNCCIIYYTKSETKETARSNHQRL